MKAKITNLVTVLLLTVASPLLAAPQFVFDDTNQKVEAEDQWGYDVAQLLFASDWSRYVEASIDTWAELNTEIRSSYIEALYANVKATGLAAAQSHFATYFTVTEECSGVLDVSWQARGVNDLAVVNIQMYIEDVETGEIILSYQVAHDVNQDVGGTTDLYSLETMVPGREYLFVAHVDALSLDGAFVYAEGLTGWRLDLVP